MKTEKNRNLKGTVLFTVVSVLSIMIIFMTCTLAMAAAANKRARKTYSSAQSSYTARTTIDSILAAIGTDKEFSKAVRSLDEGGEMNIVVNVNNPSLGTIQNAKIKYTGTKNVFDPSEDKMTWIPCNVYEISADVTIGGETTTIKSSVLQDPPQGSGGGGGAAFLTWGGADVDNHTYAWGGTYIGMGQWGDKTWNTDLKYISWYNELNKLTVLEDKEYLTHMNYHFQNDMAFETPFVVNGNLDAANGASMYFTYNSNGIDNPGIQIWGDLDIGDSCKFVMNMTNSTPFDSSDDKYGSLTEYIYKNGYSFNKMPYVYVDGALKGKKIESLGNSGVPINLFCGKLDASGNSGQMNFYADVYCMDADETSKVGGTGSHLYQWSNSVVKGGVSYSTLGGNFYSKGSVEVNSNMEVNGDMRIEGNLILNADLKVSKNLVVGGSIIPNGHKINNDNKTNIFCDSTATIDEARKNELFQNVPSTELKDFMAKKLAGGVVLIHNPSILVPNNGYPYTSNVEWGWANKNFLNDEKLKSNYSKVTDPDLGTYYDFNNHGINYYSSPTIADMTSENYYKEPEYNMNNILQGKDKVTEGVWVRKDDPSHIATDQEIADACLVTTAGGYTSIQTYKNLAESEGSIYPKRAERETLLGLSWPVKGIEHRVKNSATLSAEDYAAVHDPSKIFTQTSLGGSNITQSCTLTGDFNKTIVVNVGNTDIYIRLLNVDFKSPEITNAEGEVVSNNAARIQVNETGTGKAYFILEGKVKSNYDYSGEKANTKLIKTVYDWQKEFNLEGINKNPNGRDGKLYTSYADTAKIKIDGVEHNYFAGDATNGDMTLTGLWDTGGAVNTDLIIRAPESGEIWVTLDNFSTRNGIRLVVEDSELDANGNHVLDDQGNYKKVNGQVYFYIKGKCVFNKDSGIIESSLLNVFNDSSKKINIVSRPDDPTIMGAVQKNGYPVLQPLSTRVYSENNANIKMENGSLMTAYITAIHMNIDMPTVDDTDKICSSVIYDGQLLSATTPVTKKVGVIGMLNVGSVNANCIGDNDWTLLYVSEDPTKNTVVVDAEGAHAYEAVEYMAFSR